MIAAIILAAGRGTRMKSKKINKVALTFMGKPMILYGIELLKDIASKIVIVVGAYEASVKQVVNGEKRVIFARQKKRLGTAHATGIGIDALKTYSPSLVLVGHGDHMMFYKEETIKKLIQEHKTKKAAVSFITTLYEKPSELAWGRVERDAKGKILDIVEEKDASGIQKKIKELNAGLYCFDFKFLAKNISKIKKSPHSGEYYLTDIIKLAVVSDKTVLGIPFRFREVGIGINRFEELRESQDLYKRFHR
jgi:bifunctional N-acetylglucosamine-1-phosphate-uridyltransferase/glucosamine-1-phosphate-acetyltransferase GlmU-like protein